MLRFKVSESWVRRVKGTRLVAKTPHGHWKTTTFLAALEIHPAQNGASDTRRQPRFPGRKELNTRL